MSDPLGIFTIQKTLLLVLFILSLWHLRYLLTNKLDDKMITLHMGIICIGSIVAYFANTTYANLMYHEAKIMKNAGLDLVLFSTANIILVRIKAQREAAKHHGL